MHPITHPCSMNWACIICLMQDCSISSALAMEILQSCTKSWICVSYYLAHFIFGMHHNRKCISVVFRIYIRLSTLCHSFIFSSWGHTNLPMLVHLTIYWLRFGMPEITNQTESLQGGVASNIYDLTHQVQKVPLDAVDLSKILPRESYWEPLLLT